MAKEKAFIDMPLTELAKLYVSHKAKCEKFYSILERKHKKVYKEWAKLAEKDKLDDWDESLHPEFQRLLNKGCMHDEIQARCRWAMLTQLKALPTLHNATNYL